MPLNKETKPKMSIYTSGTLEGTYQLQLLIRTYDERQSNESVMSLQLDDHDDEISRK